MDRPRVQGAFNVAILERTLPPGFHPHDDRTYRGKFKLAHDLGTVLHRIADGLSHTLAISEIVGWDSSRDWRGLWVWPGMGCSAFSAYLTPNSKSPDRIDKGGCDESIPKRNALHCEPAGPFRGDVYAAARSQHKGGVNAAMCDGSVHFFVDGVSPDVWHALGTIRGTHVGPNAEPMPSEAMRQAMKP